MSDPERVRVATADEERWCEGVVATDDPGAKAVELVEDAAARPVRFLAPVARVEYTDQTDSMVYCLARRVRIVNRAEGTAD